MATAKLFPDGTVAPSTTGWSYAGGVSTFHAAVSDDNDATYAYTANQSESTIMTLDDFGEDFTSITSIRFFIRGVLQNTRSGDTDVQISLLKGNNAVWYAETINIIFTSGYTPADYYGTARTTNGTDAWSDAQLDDLRLKIDTTPEDPPGASEIAFMRAYVEVTYEAPPVDVTYESDTNNVILKNGMLILKDGMTEIK